LQGRPGLNHIRFSITYLITEELLNNLKKIRSILNLDPTGPKSRWIKEKEDEFFFLKNVFKRNNENIIVTQANKKDLEENLSEIKNAKKNSDLVIFSLHVHEAKVYPFTGPWREQIIKEEFPEFIREIAHKVIDAGADIFVGHGAHFLRPLEIRNGKPIFYSLCNFIFHTRTVKKRPYVDYERYNLDPITSLPYDLGNSDEENGRFMDKVHWESILPVCTFSKDNLVKSIELYPISLGHGESWTSLGTPRIAHNLLGKEIRDWLASQFIS
jgi:poly-gamma-glutamate synthesis protein (capsule biosynthesis protein)